MEKTPLLSPPSITVHKLADFEHFRLLFEAWGGWFHQTSRGRFIGTAAIYQGMSVRAFQAETNQAIFTRGQDQTEMVTVIPITKANETTSWRGRELTRGHLLVKGPDVEYYNQTSRNTIIQALLVPLQTFTQMVGPLADIMTGRKSLTSIAIQPSGGAMRRFQNSLDTLLSSLDPVHPDKAEFTERKCLDDLSVCLLSGDADKRISELGAKRLQLIDQALDIMSERIHKELKTEDICANLQVNDRMLRRVFKQSFGMGPMAIYRLMRLNLLRFELKSARGGDQTVAALADRYGFRRLGALAEEYQTHFGELPSQTLGVRKTRGEA